MTGKFKMFLHFFPSSVMDNSSYASTVILIFRGNITPQDIIEILRQYCQLQLFITMPAT